MKERTPAGVTIHTLFRNSTIELVRWQCAAGPSGMTSEMCRSWYVVSFTHSGTFLLHMANQVEIIDATRAMVIRPGERYNMSRCNESRASGSAVVVRPDVFERLGGGDDNAIARVAVPARAFLLQHLLLRAAEGKRDPGIEETALWIAGMTMSAPPRKPRRVTAPPTIVDVQTLLAANYTEPLRLPAIARAVNRSPYYLCRTFKSDTGLRMHRYLQRLRICASVGQVIEGTNLGRLAQNLGYSSHSHFNGAFHDELLVTPTELRRIGALPTLAEMLVALPS
jgi:AraC-like DNA-binding protein